MIVLILPNKLWDLDEIFSFQEYLLTIYLFGFFQIILICFLFENEYMGFDQFSFLYCHFASSLIIPVPEVEVSFWIYVMNLYFAKHITLRIFCFSSAKHFYFYRYLHIESMSFAHIKSANILREV